MCDDLALQKDELEALQSIYNQDEFKVNEDTEQVGGQFFAHLDLPRGFKVVYKLLSNKNRDKKGMINSMLEFHKMHDMIHNI